MSKRVRHYGDTYYLRQMVTGRWVWSRWTFDPITERFLVDGLGMGAVASTEATKTFSCEATALLWAEHKKYKVDEPEETHINYVAYDYELVSHGGGLIWSGKGEAYYLQDCDRGHGRRPWATPFIDEAVIHKSEEEAIAWAYEVNADIHPASFEIAGWNDHD